MTTFYHVYTSMYNNVFNINIHGAESLNKASETCIPTLDESIFKKLSAHTWFNNGIICPGILIT